MIMNKTDFKNKLKGIKLLEVKTKVTYSIYIGGFNSDALDQVELLLKNAFPGSQFSIKLADSGVVEIEDTSNVQGNSDQIIETIRSSLSDHQEQILNIGT